MHLYYLVISLVLSIIISCSVIHPDKSSEIKSLKFIGEYDLPYKMQYRNTTVGGLSSIDYDSKRDLYYLICDDRSDINPVRFYTAKISVNDKGIQDVRFVNVTYLLTPEGKLYKGRKTDPLHTPDPEALRYNPVKNNIAWSSEGERTITKEQAILVNPSICTIDMEGKLLDTFLLPPNLHVQLNEQGPRNNGVFEGIAFADNYNSLYACVEEPLFEDGPRAGLGDSSAWTRIIKYNVSTKQPIAEYAYKLDPVVRAANPPGAFKLNGISEIMTLNDHQLLITERSYSVGSPESNIRLYVGNLEAAQDVKSIFSLKDVPAVRPIRKKLVLNLDSLHKFIDNIEGVTWGPVLPNGKRSLVLVSDDNFSAAQKTQFILLEVN